MKRLLDDLAARFDLDYRIKGVPLAALIERVDVNLDEGPLQDFGTPGPADDIVTARRGSVDLHYVPHLFPEMDPKLRLAHRLQYHLLPKEVPAAAPLSIAAVLESYCHLSGDLFGWTMRPDGEFLIWIADMAGHGLETGLASAVIKLIIDSLVDEPSLEGLVGGLNETMSRCVRPGGQELYATGFFMTLAADGAAKFCSAGHPPMLVTGPTGELRELGSTCLPIGLFQDQRVVVEETRLASGETIFLYTDGLIELTTRSGEEFGLQRLRDFLDGARPEPKTLTGSLYRSLARDHDMKHLNDDVTFVAARVKAS